MTPNQENPWDEVLLQGPPKGWPGCPTPERFHEAVELRKNHPGSDQTGSDQTGSDQTGSDQTGSDEARSHHLLERAKLPDHTLAPRLRKDLITLDALCEAWRKCSEKNDGEENWDASYNLQEMIQFLPEISNDHVMGIGVSRDGMQIYGAISRDPDWVGLCPLLPPTEGLNALICTKKHHRPNMTLAIKNAEDSPRIPPEPIATSKQGVQNSRWITELLGVLTHHRAIPTLLYHR